MFGLRLSYLPYMLCLLRKFAFLIVDIAWLGA